MNESYSCAKKQLLLALVGFEVKHEAESIFTHNDAEYSQPLDTGTHFASIGMPYTLV
jgi:hypothetical protein